MGKVAFVFAGQGAQYPGMGENLYNTSAAAKAVFDVAEEVRPGTCAQTFEGSKEDLTITRNTQPCLFATDLACAQALVEAGVQPAAVAGFSLGEISALTFADVFTCQAGFEFVCTRGEVMQQAAEKHDSAMVAVVKLQNAQVEALCERFDEMYPVNYNCPGQLVVAGLKEHMADFRAAVKEAGGRAIPLAVSGGFHSPFMAEAAASLRETLSDVKVAPARIPVYANLTAAPYAADAESIRATVADQVCNPVQWQKTIEALIADGFDTFVEVGPGKTLCGLIAKIDADVATYQVEDTETLQATVQAVKSEVGA